MFQKKLAIFFVFFYMLPALGKLLLPEHIGNGNGNVMPDKNTNHFVSNKSLWVLSLNNVMDIIRLRSGNEAEEKDFNDVAGPIINRFKTRQMLNSKRMKKDNPEKYYEQISKNEENKDLRHEIMKIINKFVLTAQNEPDSYLTDTGEHTQSPSLALYFKGPFTSLVVKFGVKQWHYFISSPSPFPDWFYEDHINIIRKKQSMYVEVPDLIKNEFYKSLLPLLRTLLSFPV